MGLAGHFDSVWANDICPKKAKFYTANHGSKKFHLGSIEHVAGVELPNATLAWASFPCVDLSLAGNRAGLNAKRSGLYWEWLRVIDEMVERPILVIENVEGLFSSAGGDDYRSLHNSLVERGYRVGPMIIDAKHWVPQSRVRAFVIAVERKIDISQFIASTESWIHTRSVKEAIRGLADVLSLLSDGAIYKVASKISKEARRFTRSVRIAAKSAKPFKRLFERNSTTGYATASPIAA